MREDGVPLGLPNYLGANETFLRGEWPLLPGQHLARVLIGQVRQWSWALELWLPLELSECFVFHVLKMLNYTMQKKNLRNVYQDM